MDLARNSEAPEDFFDLIFIGTRFSGSEIKVSFKDRQVLNEDSDSI